MADLTGRATHTANKPWEYLKALDLSPPDWLGSVSINQARLAVGWRTAAFEIAAAAGRTVPVRADFEQAWTIRPVSQGKNPPPFETFADSPLGRAIIAQVGSPRSVEYLEALAEPEDASAPRPSKALAEAQLELGGRDPEDILLEAEDAITDATEDRTRQIVALLVRRGTITDLDRVLAEHLLANRPVLALFADDPGVRDRFMTEEAFRDHAFRLDEHIQTALAALILEHEDAGAEGETA